MNKGDSDYQDIGACLSLGLLELIICYYYVDTRDRRGGQ